MIEPITADLLLAAYANGYFPMAESRDDPQLLWFDPEYRGIIPLDSFHIPRSLAKFIRKNLYRHSIDRAFAEVIRACAAINSQRHETWINDRIIELYCELHARGFAHSI